MSPVLLTLNKSDIMSGDLWGRSLHFENRRCREQRAAPLFIEILVDCGWSLAHAVGLIYYVNARTSARSLTAFPPMLLIVTRRSSYLKHLPHGDRLPVGELAMKRRTFLTGSATSMAALSA